MENDETLKAIARQLDRLNTTMELLRDHFVGCFGDNGNFNGELVETLIDLVAVLAARPTELFDGTRLNIREQMERDGRLP